MALLHLAQLQKTQNFDLTNNHEGFNIQVN